MTCPSLDLFTSGGRKNIRSKNSFAKFSLHRSILAGVMRRDFSLNHWVSIHSFSLRIQYTKLQCCSFETLRAQWAIRDYLNE